MFRIVCTAFQSGSSDSLHLWIKRKTVKGHNAPNPSFSTPPFDKKHPRYSPQWKGYSADATKERYVGPGTSWFGEYLDKSNVWTLRVNLNWGIHFEILYFPFRGD